jgi:hypothetical protein
MCKKSKNTPAKCGLCGGAHTANYKGVVCVEEHIPQTTKAVNIIIT